MESKHTSITRAKHVYNNKCACNNKCKCMRV